MPARSARNLKSRQVEPLGRKEGASVETLGTCTTEIRSRLVAKTVLAADLWVGARQLYGIC
ncbi:MAG: hypothetical protein RL011_586 [Pseudomonadota bacterium]|jgi:hypothetical protein